MLLNITLGFYVALIWLFMNKSEYLEDWIFVLYIKKAKQQSMYLPMYLICFWVFFCFSLPIVPSAFTYLQCCHSWKWVRLSWMYHFPIGIFPLKSYALLFRFFNQKTKLVSSSTWCKTWQLCSHYYADFYLSPTKCWLPSLTADIFHHKLPH